VNELIPPAYRTVTYPRFRDVARIVWAIGPDGFIWIADAMDAFLQLTIHRDDISLMGLKWQGAYFTFGVMMFGVACAPQAYGRFADLVVDIIIRSFPGVFSPVMLDRLRVLFDRLFRR
jgi:hypothetical protein